MMIKSILISFLVFSLAGCQTTRYIEKYSEPLKQGVYAAKKANDLGRFDLSTRYVDSLTKLVPPPDKPIDIQALYIDDKEIKK